MDHAGWVRLNDAEDRRFRLQRAAALAHVRATLPTRLSRRTLVLGKATPGAMPAEIWCNGHELALVWHVRHERAAAGSPAKRVVGFVRQAPGQSIDLLDGPHANTALPPPLRDAEVIRFSDSFWRSDKPELDQAPPPEPPELPPNHAEDDIDQAPATENATENDTEDTTEAEAETEAKEPPQERRIRDALLVIDNALREYVAKSTSRPLLSATPVPIETPDEATNWRLEGDLRERQLVADLLKRARVCNFRLEAEDTNRMVLLKREVPFYKGCRLYRVIDMRGLRSRFASFVLHLESADLAALHTKPTPIFEFNNRRLQRGELLLDERNTAAYVRFYCEFVQGDAGAFSIIESPKEIRWLSQADGNSHAEQAHDEAQASGTALKEVFSSALQPVHLYRLTFQSDDSCEPSAQEFLHCRVFVGYGRHLFAAGLAVRQDGWMDMFEDSALHDNALPIQPLSFNTESQFRLRTADEPATAPNRRV